MNWHPLRYDRAEAREFEKRFKKKARYLVDESLGHEVAEVLRNLGYNTKYISDFGLEGHSDEDVFATAWKEERILLSHDQDFLDDRRFPPHRNPGLVVIGVNASGGKDINLVRCLVKITWLLGDTGNAWKGAKIFFSDEMNLRITRRNPETGMMQETRFLWTPKGAMQWANE